MEKKSILSSNGQNPDIINRNFLTAGGGSGGSIYIKCHEIINRGSIQVTGATSGRRIGEPGGLRIDFHKGNFSSE